MTWSYFQFSCNEKCCDSNKLKLMFHHIFSGAQKTIYKVDTQVESLPVQPVYLTHLGSRKRKFVTSFRCNIPLSSYQPLKDKKCKLSKYFNLSVWISFTSGWSDLITSIIQSNKMDLMRGCKVGCLLNTFDFRMYWDSFRSIWVQTSCESAQLKTGKGDNLQTFVQMFLNRNWELSTTVSGDLMSDSGDSGSLGTRVQVFIEEFSDIGIHWVWNSKYSLVICGDQIYSEYWLLRKDEIHKIYCSILSVYFAMKKITIYLFGLLIKCSVFHRIRFF